MKSITAHIEYVQGQPHHIRRNIATGVAAGISAFVALVWFVGNYAVGTFAIHGNAFAMNAGQSATVATTSEPGNPGIAGVAGSLQEKTAPIHIEVVDTHPPVTSQKQSDKTILPF